MANSQSGLKIPKIQGIINPPSFNPRKLSILSGPISFTFYHDLQGRRVLLLGDRHDAVHLCNVNVCNIDRKQLDYHVYEVHDWLMDLAKSSPECLDIFCELPYIIKKGHNFNIYGQSIPNKPLKEYSAPIYAVRSKFRYCLNDPLKC